MDEPRPAGALGDGDGGRCGGGLSADTIVWSNNPAPGDAFTNPAPLPSNATQAVGTSGWYYSNVREGGTIGINTEFARSGNGSVRFESLNGGAKADITYFTGQQLGTLDELTSLSYDWYRDLASDNPGAQAPSIRLLLGDGTSLVWEAVYNGQTDPVTEGSWVSSNAFAGGSGIFWRNTNQDDRRSFNDWLSVLGQTGVVGVNSGVGSGWNGYFLGAVDNIEFGFNNSSKTYNFEVVPEPSSVAMGLIAGGVGLVAAARRRSQRS